MTAPVGFKDPNRKDLISEYKWVVVGGIPLLAILFQVYVPRFIPYLSYLELPLLVTVYFSLMRRSPLLGVTYGMGIGLAQDALSHHPLGMYGIVKTLVGYFAAFLSMRFDVEQSGVRFALGFFFFLFHQCFYWMMTRALLGEHLDLAFGQALVFSLLNAAVGVPLFAVLDKLRV